MLQAPLEAEKLLNMALNMKQWNLKQLKEEKAGEVWIQQVPFR